MRRFIGCLLIVFMTLGLCACGEKVDDSEKASEETLLTSKLDESNTVITGAANATNTVNENYSLPEDIADSIVEEAKTLNNIIDIEYLEEDEMFLITNSEYANGVENKNYYVTDKNGKAKALNTVSLNSEYLKYDYDNETIVNIYGEDVTNRFITDSKSDTYWKIDKTDQGTVVWIKHCEETPVSATNEFVAFDEYGVELFRFNPDENDLNSMGNSIACSYEGSDVFMFYALPKVYTTTSGLCCNPYKKKLFWVSEFVNDEYKRKPNYSKGFAIDHSKNRIIDNEGNTIYSSETNEELDSSVLSIISDGVFYNSNKGIFYDADLNIIADLSEYDYPHFSSPLFYLFENGFLQIDLENDNNTTFRGVLSANGEWMIPLEKVDSENNISYISRLSDNVFLVSSPNNRQVYLYNIKSKKNADYDLHDFINLDGFAYYIEYGNVYYYDFETFTKEQIEITIAS